MSNETTFGHATGSYVQCINCQNFTFRRAGEMAQFGFGKCAWGAKFEFYGSSASRQCKRFERADQGLIDSRLRWRETKLAEFTRAAKADNERRSENAMGAQS